jgi:antitoxin PrlF
MPSIRETATVTSKGQVTLPKSIRQALGIDVGGKVTFELHGEKVIVTRATDAAHEDPAIAGFLRLLKQDLRSGRQINGLPQPLLRKMLAAAEQPVDLQTEIEGHVAL